MIFDRLTEPLPRPGLRGDVTWTPLDDRWYQHFSAFNKTFAGFPIGPETAKRVSAVFACNSLIAETVASLPCILYRRRDDGGKDRAREHPLYRTLRQRPNWWQTPMDFFASAQMHVGLRGNGLAKIQTDRDRIDLVPLHPDYTTVETISKGRFRYRVRDPHGADDQVLLQDEVVHVRDLSDDGISGQARAVLAREAIGVAAAGEAFVAGFFKNDATGRLVVSHKGQLPTKEKRDELRASIRENYAGWQNRSNTMILYGDSTVTELGSQADSGFIVDPRKFQVADIARFWRIPLFMIGLEEKSTSWGSGVESQKQSFVDFTIKPWLDRWAQALSRDLLTDDEQDEYVIEFLLADLVRGDLKTRFEAYQIGRGIGVWSPNEIRQKENEAPREGGDEYQQTQTGAPPNAPVQPSAALPTGAPADDTKAETMFQVFVADAATRIAGFEAREIGKRADKAAADSLTFLRWLHEFYQGQRAYNAKTLATLVVAGQFEPWVLDVACGQIELSGMRALGHGAVPEGWLDQRAEELQGVLSTVFTRARQPAAA